MTDFSRRTFVKGAFARGACSVLPGRHLFAQAAASSAAARMVGAYKGRFGQFAVLPMPDITRLARS